MAAIVGVSADPPSLYDDRRSVPGPVQTRRIFVDPRECVRQGQGARRESDPRSFVSWFDGKSSASLADAPAKRRALVARRRRRARPARRDQVPREEAFEREEKRAMLPPPSAPFDVPTWTEAKFIPITTWKSRSSLLGTDALHPAGCVRVRADEHRRTSSRDGARRRTPRVAQGKRSTDASDYPRLEQATYAPQRRAPARARAKRAARMSVSTPRSCSAGRCRGRACVGLIRLCDTYGGRSASRPLRSALAFGVVGFPSRASVAMLKAAAVPSTRNGRWQGRVDRDAAVREVH